ncbi:nitroreductase family protein [Pseudomonas aeruginosa]|uniref:nitroreductase family protein n=1 Tax=Pseudomonas aeruginosa TaxID=287 RepID=UPI001912F21C|nr:nitroreductase family protein [Pseudomonas aeruginosa]WCW86680.1 nitroreductase family protein [Pseudomonas aeruginosa]
MSKEQREVLQLRYGHQKKPEDFILNPTIMTLLSHKSVRNFLADPLPSGAIETMVAASQSAATSSNLHQWSVVVVTDPEIKYQVWELSAGKEREYNHYIKQAPAIMLWVADLSHSYEVVRDQGGDTDVYDYLDSFVTATIDATLAAQNSAIAAESMGLGYCFIGASRNRAKELAELIKLPKHSYVTFGLVVGFPDEEKPSLISPRPAQDAVLHYNYYDDMRFSLHLTGYDSVYREFRKEAGMREMTWRESVTYSTGFSYLDGRECLRDALSFQGLMLK